MTQERDIQNFEDRFEELVNRRSIVSVRFEAWFESMRDDRSFSISDLLKIDQLVRISEDGSAVEGDYCWVRALIDEGVPANILLAIWARKDDFSQKMRDEVDDN